MGDGGGGGGGNAIGLAVVLVRALALVLHVKRQVVVLEVLCVVWEEEEGAKNEFAKEEEWITGGV